MVEYITIRDKKYPVRIGYFVMKKVQEEFGMSLGQALKQSEENPQVHEVILYGALKVGAFAEDAEMPFDREDMPMILDLCFPEYIGLFTSPKFFPPELVEKLEEKVGKVQEATRKESPMKRSPKKPKT